MEKREGSCAEKKKESAEVANEGAKNCRASMELNGPTEAREGKSVFRAGGRSEVRVLKWLSGGQAKGRGATKRSIRRALKRFTKETVHVGGEVKDVGRWENLQIKNQRKVGKGGTKN